MKKITKWEPDRFKLEINTVWSFPNRGDWATHDGKWRGNWSPYIPRNLLLRYSKVNDLVLDQFVGGGTTLIEAKLLKRNILGVDINETSIEYCKEKIKFKWDNTGEVFIRKSDATNLKFVPDKSIDFICTHPPYANIIEYSKDTIGDLSHCKIPQFLYEIKKVAFESYRVLKNDKFCAILMGDIRINGYVQPMSFEVMKIFQAQGFKLKEIIIKEQHNCKTTNYWAVNSKKHNFLLLANEYLFIFKK